MLRHVFSTFLALILIPATFGALITVNAERVLLNPAFIKSTLRKDDLYRKAIEDGPSAAFDIFLQSQGLASAARLGPLAKEDVVGVVKKSIPAQWFEENVNAVLDQGFLYATGKRDDVDLKMSLVDIKANFSYYAGKEVRGKINSLPYCGAEELRRLQWSGSMAGLAGLNCRPAGVDARSIERFLGGANDPLAMIPNQVDLGELFRAHQKQFSQARAYVGVFMLAEKVLVFFALGIVVLLIMINVRHKKAAGIYVGAPIILASVGVIGLGKLLRYMAGAPLSQGVKMPESAKKLLLDFAGSFAHQISQSLFVTAGLAAIVGIGFMIVMVKMGREASSFGKRGIDGGSDQF